MKISILILSLFIWLTGCAPPDAQVVERQIAGSKTLQGLDELCSGLPKPSDFEFVYKKISGNAGITSLSFRYRSSLEKTKVFDFYRRELPPLGWEFNREGDWENGDRRISVLKVDFPEADYSMHCAELAP